MPVQGSPKKRPAGQDEPAPNPINDRAGALPPEFIQDNPHTSLGLLFSQMPNDAFKAAAQGLNSVYPWLKMNNGPAGSFLAPRALAASITDPLMKGLAHGVLDALQHAAQAPATDTMHSVQSAINEATRQSNQLQQQAANAPVAPPNPVTHGPGKRGSLTTQAQGFFSYNENGLKIEVDPTHKTVTLPTNDTSDPSYQAALATMHNYYPDWTVVTVSANDNVRALSDVIGAIGKGLDAPFAAADWATQNLPGPLHAINTGVKKSESGFNIAWGRAEDVATGAIEETYHIPETLIENTLGGEHNSYKLPWKYWWPDQPGSALGNAVTAGMNPNDPATQTFAQASDLVGQFILGKFAGEFFRGVKSGRSTVTTLGAKPEIDSAIERAGFDLANNPVSEFGATRTGRMFARSIDAAKAKYGSKAGAMILKHYGDGIVTKTFANIVNHVASGTEAVQAWTDLASNTDPRILAKLVDRQGEIQTRLGELGREQSNAIRSKFDDKIEAIQRRMENAPPEEAARLEQELTDLRAKAPPRTTGERMREIQNEQSQLKAEQKSIRSTLQKPANGWEPVRQLPTKATILKVTAADSPLGSFLHMLYEPPTRWAPHLSRVFDLLGNTTIYNPFKVDRPIDAHPRNIHTLRTWLRGAGVDEPHLDGLVQQYLNMTNDSDFHRFMNAVGGAIEQHGKYLAADERTHMSTLFRNTDLEARRRSQIEDTLPPDASPGAHPGRQAVLHTEDGTQLPSMSAEMINDFNLPPIEELRRARSLTREAIRRSSRKFEGTSLERISPEQMYRMLMTVNRSVTNVFKGAILIPRIVGQALILRVQGEQSLRTKLSGLPIFSKDKLAKWHLISPARGRLFTESTRAALDARIIDYTQAHEQGYVLTDTPTIQQLPDGRWQAGVSMVRRDVADMQRFRPEAKNENLGLLDFSSDPNSNGNLLNYISRLTEDANGHLDDLAASIITDRIIHRFSSPEMRKLIELQGNTAEWEKWLKSNPVGQAALENMQENLNRAGVSIQEWGKRSYRAAQQYAGHNERILDSMVTGTWANVNPAAATDVLEGRPGKHMLSYEDASRYDSLQEDLVGNRDALDSAINANDTGLITALTKERTGIINEMSQIEKKLPAQDFTEVGLGPTPTTPTKVGARSIPLGDRMRIIAQLKQAYEDGTFKPPVEVNGELRNDLITRLEGAKRQTRWYADANRWAMSLLDKEDVTRRGMFTKVAAGEYNRLRNLGYSDADAFAHAKAYAARVTRDVMYDLTERSSLQRAMKNWFWFLPAVQELLTTWFIKIPSKSYWPVGIASMYAQAHAIMGLFRLTGAIQKNADGQDVIVVPGLGELLSKMTGTKIPDQVYGYPSGLNIAAGGLPSFSAQGQALIEAANKIDPHSKAIQALHEFVHKYTPANTFFPAAINDAVEGITGKANPLEIFAHGYQQQTVNSGLKLASQQAMMSMPPPPNPNDPKYGTSAAGEQRYANDRDKWLAEWQSKTRSTYRGWQLLMAFGAVSSPMSLHVTDPIREQWNHLNSTVIAPERQAGNFSKAQQDAQNFVNEHPGAFAYTVGGSHPTAKAPKDIYDHLNSSKAYAQANYQGFIKNYGLKDYTTYVAGMESYRLYQAQQTQALNLTGTTGAQQLLHGYQRGQAFDTNRAEWNKYLAWNTDFAALWNKRDDIAKKIGLPGHPYQDYAISQASQTMDLLNELAPKIEAAGIPGGDIRAITGQLAALYDGSSARSTPHTPQAKYIRDYMTNTYIPYVTKLHDLFTEAGNLSDRGINPGPVYDQIRQYEEAQSNLAKKNGYPDPQMVTWGNKSPEEQRLSKVKWATEPVSWLTSFQRGQAGYDKHFSLKPNVINGFFTYEAHLHDWILRYEKQHSVSANSNAGQAIEQWRVKYLDWQAQRHGGKQLVNLFNLDSAPPANRLWTLGYGRNVPGFAQLVSDANTKIQEMNKDGVSPSGNSAEAVFYRSWFHSEVEKMRATDKSGDLDNLFTDLSTAAPTKGGGYMQGNALYDAMFFNARPITIYPTSQPWSQEKLVGQGNGPESVSKWLQTYQNGKIPLTAMTTIGGGFYLQPAAASEFDKAEAAAKQDGIDLLASVTSAYRSYQHQSDIYANPGAYDATDPAPPGRSNHGWGLALDFAPGSPGWNWMRGHGIQFGWDWTGAQIGDPSHFTFRSAPGI